MDRIHYFADNEFCAEGVISNGMLYISGQLSLDLDTREVAVGGQLT